MDNLDNRFEHAFDAWQQWNLTDADKRAEILTDSITCLADNLKAAARFQLEHGLKIASKVHQLTGPTGETNELYSSGRGVAVLAIESHAANAMMASIAMLYALLIAGNSVVVCCDDDTQVSHFAEPLKAQKLPEGLLQLAEFKAFEILLHSDIRNFVYIGNCRTERDINRQLASRDGAITALVAETDLEQLPQSQDPKLILHFITERTRTINITAVGGNATLLELGSDFG